MSSRWAAIDVLSVGAYASIQDTGRYGLRRFGVPWSGALDHEWQVLANALVGNAFGAALIEHFDGGLHLRVACGAVVLAIAGEVETEIGQPGETTCCEGWRSLLLRAGDEFRVRRLSAGRLAYVAIAGLRAAHFLGSASTCARAGIGQALVAGDVLTAAAADQNSNDDLRQIDHPPSGKKTPIRVIAGPQDDHFTADALARIGEAEFTVSGQADRMGIRLLGPPLVHRSPAHREIVSDATVPGSIQVPGNGQPIVLLADAQTAGGYPKIATVISADLGRLANVRPGGAVRFRVIDVTAGELAARAQAATLARLLTTIRPSRGIGGVDLAALYTGNLISGVFSDSPDGA